jgi:anti-sigma factor ChrR (cupin superfamily)
VTSLRADDVPSVDYYPGFAGGHYLRLKLEAVSASCESRLTPARCSLISIHNSGPEYIHVVEGIFGDGAHEYHPGTFILHPAESSHIPQSRSGCKLIVILPSR